MLSFFRRVSKSKIGTWIMAAILVAILAGFAVTDISNFGSGNIGFGMGSSTLASVGNQSVGDREMSEGMQRRLQQVRQQKPDADYSTVIGDFETLLSELIDQKTLFAFADKIDFHLSKRLVDAEIAQIPQTKGLNGQFSEEAYRVFLGQQRLTDDTVRELLSGGLLQRLVLTPVVTNARATVGMATPYASMLLEARTGVVAAIPMGTFLPGLKPTDADIQTFYNANRSRYMVPEQRVLRIARIGPEQVANVTASDQEVTAYYNAHKADYAPKESRSLTQAVVPDQAAANAIASRAKAGTALSAAAGANGAVTSLNDQSREAYAGVAGDKVAAAAFAAPAGSVVGPVQSDFGWVVVKVDSVKTAGGKSLEQAKAEISSKITADKRKGAIEDLVDKVQDAVDNGSNFAEAATAAKLAVSTTPLIMASGTSHADKSYKLPPELAPALKTGFEIAPNDPPEIVTLTNDQGYAMVSPGQVVSAAPAPLATVHDQVANDWINNQAMERAKATATQVAAKVAKGEALEQAMKEANPNLPGVRQVGARRIQLATAQGQVPAPLQVLFTLGQGKSKMFADPEGRGFYIVKVDKIVPGNAMLQPGLIGRTATELQDAISDEYARQFMAALRKELKVKRNESAIQGMKARLLSSGG